MRNAGLDEAQAGIKMARRNINNLRYADDTTLMAESEEELKRLLMKLKSESEVAQSYLTLSNSMDCSLPGSSIHGIFQARVLEWGAIAFSVMYYKVFQICYFSTSCLPLIYVGDREMGYIGHLNAQPLKQGIFLFYTGFLFYEDTSFSRIAAVSLRCMLAYWK